MKAVKSTLHKYNQYDFLLYELSFFACKLYKYILKPYLYIVHFLILLFL